MRVFSWVMVNISLSSVFLRRVQSDVLRCKYNQFLYYLIVSGQVFHCFVTRNQEGYIGYIPPVILYIKPLSLRKGYDCTCLQR